jgi:hypothetical protein
MRAYDLEGDSRSAHKMSAASMMTVKGPSGTTILRREELFRFVRSYEKNDSHAAPCLTLFRTDSARSGDDVSL